jgi:hypothetical protein
MDNKPNRRVLITMDESLIQWLDEEGKRLGRSRAWLVNRYCTQAMNRKEYQRKGMGNGRSKTSSKSGG